MHGLKSSCRALILEIVGIKYIGMRWYDGIFGMRWYDGIGMRWYDVIFGLDEAIDLVYKLD